MSTLYAAWIQLKLWKRFVVSSENSGCISCKPSCSENFPSWSESDRSYSFYLRTLKHQKFRNVLTVSVFGDDRCMRQRSRCLNLPGKNWNICSHHPQPLNWELYILCLIPSLLYRVEHMAQSCMSSSGGIFKYVCYTCYIFPSTLWWREVVNFFPVQTFRST